MKSLVRVVILALVIGLLASGCGGKSDSDPAPADAGSQEQTDSAASEEAAVAGDPANGQALYDQGCVACHGPGGAGVENLGKPFTTSEFLTSVSDEELVAFIKQGRDPSDPANTTGVAMPPKGGNPALSDEQLNDIVAYVRTLHE